MTTNDYLHKMTSETLNHLFNSLQYLDIWVLLINHIIILFTTFNKLGT